MHFQKY